MRAAGLALFAAATTVIAGPLAHSHNDYEQPRPLHDALAQRFDSVEADVWLADGQLLVAHEATELKGDRTLERLYLDPLREWARASSARSLILLIDVKSEATATWRAIDAALAKYPDLEGRVRFIISGNRAREALAMQSRRRAGLDGRIEDLDGLADADLIPLISDNWAKFFTWRGVGEFPAAERARLAGFVAQAHARHRMLRFWNTPDLPDFWRALRAAGVDMIGTDHLIELRRVLDPS